MIDLTGKTALMTGGMPDLTGPIAACLASAGAKIVLGHAAADGGRARTIEERLAGDGLAAQRVEVDLDAPDTMVGQLAVVSAIDIAVILPGWFDIRPFMDTDPADWDEALDRNLAHMTFAAQAVSRHMIARGHGGRLLLLSSVAGLMPFVELSTYGTSLAAMRALAKMAAVDLGPYGITVNVVAAGWAGTEQTSRFLGADGRAFVERGIPLGRMADPAEIGNLFCFLASDMASYITGAVIPVDGGYLLTRADGRSPFPGHDASYG